MAYVLNTNTPSISLFLDSINATSIMTIDEATGVCTSDIAWYVQPPIQTPLGQTMLLSLIDCQFGHVFPNVTQYNNTLVYSVDDGVNYLTKTIPEDQYNIDTLVTWLNANTSPYVWTINYVTYKLTVTSGSSTIRISSASTAGGLIGLTKDRLGQFVDYSSGFYNFGTLPSWFNCSGPPFIFLKIRNISVATQDSGEGNDSALARIDLNCPFGSVVFYRPAAIEQHLTPMPAIDNVHVFLTDHRNNPMCLKGVNLQLNLRVSFVQNIESTPVADIKTLDRDALTTVDEYKKIIKQIPLELYGEAPDALGVD